VSSSRHPCGRAGSHEDPSWTFQHVDPDGAIALAKRLQQYWHDQGYPAARFWTEPLDERFAKIGAYDLVNGLPPGYRGESD
jgi:hypothetical protein